MCMTHYYDVISYIPMTSSYLFLVQLDLDLFQEIEQRNKPTEDDKLIMTLSYAMATTLATGKP